MMSTQNEHPITEDKVQHTPEKVTSSETLFLGNLFYLFIYFTKYWFQFDFVSHQRTELSTEFESFVIAIYDLSMIKLFFLFV